MCLICSFLYAECFGFMFSIFFFFNDTATTEIYTRSIVGSVRCVQETGYQRRVHGIYQCLAFLIASSTVKNIMMRYMNLGTSTCQKKYSIKCRKLDCSLKLNGEVLEYKCQEDGCTL
eukprot:TRINITY_DN5976_c0_g1_i6.p1 TRINITY_DN5976_c0_g1~~TRINITY_DN5976_c0_g1_i6.p1  ORF type:complete len:127 (+),score=21.56 TRINITY_DN5976_c0_g1_i6:33-383(+)